MEGVFVNIACGDSYVEGWLNCDYAPHSTHVVQADLLKRLPAESDSADVVYSSHFLEHIPRALVFKFLSECFRITKRGGRVRLVLPDLEEMCRAYLAARERGEHDKADFLVLEMLDQCVRLVPGGELGDFYARMQSSPEMAAFIRQRTGHEIGLLSTAASGGWRRMLRNPTQLRGRLERIYCEMVLALLPSAFRQQNVSLARVGERHAWIYDFQSVERLLKEAGFVDVTRVTATTSAIPDFPFFPLDVMSDGQPRKGLESMYIEAAKP